MTSPSLPEFLLHIYATGMRYQDRDDMILFELPSGTSVSAVFTQSSYPAAPVTWSQARINARNQARALLVNAGVANAMTGDQGEQSCVDSASAVSKLLKIDPDSVLLASTGIIGVQIDVNCIKDKLRSPPHDPKEPTTNPPLPLTAESLERATRAICTTDTFPKTASISTKIDNQTVTVMGMAKGSGMIAPDMATMLAFVFTDAAIDQKSWQNLCCDVNRQTFSRLTIDGDTSTNDCLIMLASGHAMHEPISDVSQDGYQQLRDAVQHVCLDLVKALARDGEGAKKSVHVKISGADDDSQADLVAKNIAESPLVKTALSAGDANWGRIAMAIGKSNLRLDVHKLQISVNGHVIVTNGVEDPGYCEEILNPSLQRSNIVITAVIGSGSGSSERWTCDFSEAYIHINGAYRT